jgi:hypothetical protein
VRRVIQLRRDALPEGPLRNERGEMEARWYVAQRYLDQATMLPTQTLALEQLQIYFDLAKRYGDPDQARFTRASQLAVQLKGELRAAALPREKPAAKPEDKPEPAGAQPP